MLKPTESPQDELEFVAISSLVPEGHLLRKIDRAVDFGFIRNRVKHLYCENNGRPALDPVVLFKLLLLGYLFGVRSERQLMREVEVNVAYRWFLGLRLRDKVPDASTLSQNRRRRFAESTVYQEIFDEIVELAVRKGLASGTEPKLVAKIVRLRDTERASGALLRSWASHQKYHSKTSASEQEMRPLTIFATCRNVRV